MHLNFLKKHLIQCSEKITIFRFLLTCLSLVWLLYLLLNVSPTEIRATATYYDKCEMYLTGTLIYRGTSTGQQPVDNLNGRTMKIYLNGESERALAIDPYLTNMCSRTVEGWIEAGYEITIPFSQNLHVSQNIYSTNGSSRMGTAYYDVDVEEIQTNLLYRPERNNTYINLIITGIVLLSIWCVIKGVRHD